ncbi:MAG: hypothetical protein GY763_00460 [Gammaproteobacteria bacterium]|nr:hypothetical protein [Gammaproteobacteria bacterium]
MNKFILIAGLIFSSWSHAVESTVTVPWPEFDTIYKERIAQDLKTKEVTEPAPVMVLENIEYDLKVHESQVTGTVSVNGSVLSGDPEPLPLFGHNIAVTNIVDAQNAILMAKNGRYQLDTVESGIFSIRFTVSIPITDFQVKPRLVFDVPAAVRNELKIKTDESLEIRQSDSLHKIDGSYFFSPRSELNVVFEHVGQPLTGSEPEDKLLDEVDTPSAVLHSVTFFTSFAEDGTVLSAMQLELPPNDENQLVLDPIEAAEVWSLHVNGQPRSLYVSAADRWVVPLDPKVKSKIVLAYLTRNQKLGLEGRLDFDIPETGLTARQVNLVVGLPERMHMLAMDSDLQPASGRGWATFDSFSGRPHFFSKPFYRGRAFSASVIYQEPVNP